MSFTGEVYLNGTPLAEAATLEAVGKPTKNGQRMWYCQADDETTSIWADFHEADPNKECVEIHVRETCFYPDKPGRNYITVRGFRMSQAATQWAAPTAEQIALIGTHWSKGWIIENNVISDSKCVGVTLGKDRASGHNDAQSADGYNIVVNWRTAGRKRISAPTSSETIRSPIAGRPASAAAWEGLSAGLPEITSTTSTSTNPSAEPRWPASNCTLPSTR